MGCSAVRNGDVLAWRACTPSGPGGTDRGRADTKAPSNGSECTFWIPASWRFSVLDERVPAALTRRGTPQLAGGARFARQETGNSAQRHGPALRHTDQHDATAEVDREHGLRGTCHDP